jgi:hypothetical protein
VPLLIVIASVAMSACSVGPTSTHGEEQSADTTILFVGNSLTYVHDVPRLVSEIAQRHGMSVATVSIASANFSLEDHWQRGIASDIRRIRPDFVVMQQGPSSLPDSRAHLVHWAGRLAEVIREVGAEPALYMVWPDETRRFAFPDVEASYAAAADAVDGVLLPVGTTWLRAWDIDPSLALYGDGLHASYLGALAAAYTIVAGLLEIDPAELPTLPGNVPTSHVDAVRSAAGTSLRQWRARTDPSRHSALPGFRPYPGDTRSNAR